MKNINKFLLFNPQWKRNGFFSNFGNKIFSNRHFKWHNFYLYFSVTIIKLIIIVAILCFLILIVLIFYIDDVKLSSSKFISKNGHNVRIIKFLNFNTKHLSKKKYTDLEKERRIFQFVRQEHIKLIERFNEINKNMETLLREIPLKELELKELELHIEELRFLQRELNDRRNVHLKLPNPPLFFTDNLNNNTLTLNKENFNFNKFESSIDYRRCSISAIFQVYLYKPLEEYQTVYAKNLYYEFSINNAITFNKSEACLFLGIFEKNFKNFNFLENWNKNGQNHVILFVNPNKTFTYKKYDAAIIVSSEFSIRNFRHSMDIAVNLEVPPYNELEYKRLPRLLPYNRENLLTFVCGINSKLTKLEKDTFESLKISMRNSQDFYLIETNCLPENANRSERLSLCYDEKQRINFSKKSFFTLIFDNCNTFQKRFYESLLGGSIPVIISTNKPQTSLPFEEFIDWRLASIKIALARFPELHFILRSISTADLLEMRRKARFYLENYLCNTKTLSNTILSFLRFRLLMFANKRIDLKTNVIVDPKEFSYKIMATRPPYDDEYLGPVETPIFSNSFQHNITSLLMYSYKLWNELPLHVKFTPEFLEVNYMLPSEAEFDNESSFGMRPIMPGSGQEFSVALGGNRRKEQFTIIMMTYNRDFILNASLERLYQLPYLNKIIVVWNNVNRLKPQNWPKLHVPIVFINASKNSLNNRFMPYNEIETEAVLSLDDDIDLKQHEIIFAFRTWREQRHRIVGFPARYHARYGDSMFYNSNHTCQLSMILTGAAFLHKSYFYAYTYLMPEIIRKKVDEWMNCEDLAMNFLVSHLTRQPPIKTTSKWTLKCPTCPETLSKDVSHFNERHNCIRFLTKVFGYNPLLFTQFRVDSVLFKTRVPPNHQKCFRYV